MIASDPYDLSKDGLASFPYIEANSGVFSGSLVSGSRGGPLYFPIAYRFVSLFSLFPTAIAFFLFLVIIISGSLLIFFKELKEEHKSDSILNVLILLLASYPFLFALDRANFEIFTFFFLYLFISFYNSHPRVSLISLAIAIGMKGFPAIFLLLYLSDRKFKEIAAVCLLALAGTILGYATFPGGFNQNFINHLINLNLSGRLFSGANAGLIFGHSLFGAIKFLVINFSSTALVDDFARAIQTPYFIFSILVSLLLALYIIFSEKEFW